MTTWGEARQRAIERLRSGADPATAALDADVLLAFVLDVGKETLFAHPERPLTDEAGERFQALVERRAHGEPVAYLRGFKEFYGQRFAVDPRVLIPRPETETLVDAARAYIAETLAAATTRGAPGRGLIVVDVGTGSGAIACSIAMHEPEVRVVATDVSNDALAVARANARALQVDDRVEFRAGDLLEPITEIVDVVCANLPYLPADALRDLRGERTSLAFEPDVAIVSGRDGLDLIRRCAADLPRVLAPGGGAFFECDPPQSGEIASLLEAAGLRTRVLRDLAGNERVVEARRPIR